MAPLLDDGDLLARVLDDHPDKRDAAERAVDLFREVLAKVLSGDWTEGGFESGGFVVTIKPKRPHWADTLSQEICPICVRHYTKCVCIKH